MSYITGKYVYAITIKPLKGVLKKDGTYSKGAVSKDASNRPRFLNRFFERLNALCKCSATLVKEFHSDGWAHYHGVIGCS